MFTIAIHQAAVPRFPCSCAARAQRALQVPNMLQFRVPGTYPIQYTFVLPETPTSSAVASTCSGAGYPRIFIRLQVGHPIG